MKKPFLTTKRGSIASSTRRTAPADPVAEKIRRLRDSYVDWEDISEVTQPDININLYTSPAMTSPEEPKPKVSPAQIEVGVNAAVKILNLFKADWAKVVGLVVLVASGVFVAGKSFGWF
jgi:hypothetical protein